MKLRKVESHLLQQTCETLKKIIGKNITSLSYVNEITGNETAFDFDHNNVEFVSQMQTQNLLKHNLSKNHVEILLYFVTN